MYGNHPFPDTSATARSGSGSGMGRTLGLCGLPVEPFRLRPPMLQERTIR